MIVHKSLYVLKHFSMCRLRMCMHTHTTDYILLHIIWTYIWYSYHSVLLHTKMFLSYKLQQQ